MAVVNTKPHRLEYLTISPGHEDEEGNYHPGESSWEGNIECDAVPAGKAEERTFEDGVIRKYSYTVYLPDNCRDFSIGDRVRIGLLVGIIREFEVKGFHRWQQQCKIWV